MTGIKECDEPRFQESTASGDINISDVIQRLETGFNQVGIGGGNGSGPSSAVVGWEDVDNDRGSLGSGSDPFAVGNGDWS